MIQRRLVCTSHRADVVPSPPPTTNVLFKRATERGGGGGESATGNTATGNVFSAVGEPHR